MHHVVCAQDQAGADGFVVAWDADTGRELWRYKTAPVESSPLLHGNRLYVGSWDNGVHAINAKTGKRIWRFQADNQVNTSAAWWRGRIFIGVGQRHALRAQRQDREAALELRRRAREFWYATPTVAYGRVYIGNTDGTMYVFGAKSGKLLWARPLGSYIYGAAAVYRRKVFVGTYDGKFYALDAATGDVRWQIDARRRGARGADGDGRASCTTRSARAAARRRSGGGARPRRHLRGARPRRARGCGASRPASTRTRWSPTSDRIYITGRAHEFALRAQGLEGRQGVPGSRSEPRRNALQSTVRRASSEAEESPLTCSEWSRPGSSSTSSAGFSGTVAAAPGRVGRAAHEQRGGAGAAQRARRSRRGSGAA